jgi:hypothetical protein
MDLDALNIAPEEIKRRKGRKLCFKCGKPGHMAKAHFQKKGGKGKEAQKKGTKHKVHAMEDDDGGETIWHIYPRHPNHSTPKLLRFPVPKKTFLYRVSSAS